MYHSPLSQKKGIHGGYAMLTAVLFFLFATSVIVLGTSSSVLREMQAASDLLKTKASYFTSESGSEDAVYRLKNGLAISNTENLLLDGYQSTTTVTTGSGTTIVSAISDRLGYVRKVSTRLDQGVGASFFYGVQVGAGGLTLQQSASVVGNVYSNGPVIGDGNVSTGNASNPPLTGSVPIGWGGNPPVDVVISGAYAYVLCDSTFMVVDISNKASPVIKKTVTTALIGNHAHFSIAVSGNYLYIVQGNNYVLSIYDIINPLEPVLLPSVNIGAGGYPKTVTVSGGYAYVTRYTNSGPAVQIINVSNPASAVLVKTMAVPNWPRWITISGGHMYVTFDQGGTANMQIYSLTDPANPTLQYTMPSALMLGGHAREYIAGKYMYVDAGDNGRLHVADITNKTSPIVKFDSPYNIIYRPTRMDGAAGYLYISENAYTGNTATPRFQIWSIANPILPVQVNTINIPPIEWGIVATVVKNGYLFILDSGYNTTGNLRLYYIGGGSGGNSISGDVVSADTTGRIEKINAGGSIYANTVIDSIAGKDAYYTTMTRSTVEGASYPGSTPMATSTMPISDEQITLWEGDAVAGGTAVCIDGSYEVIDFVALGPKKIPCDLNVRNGGRLSLTGPVWVSGNIKLKGNSSIEVHSSIPGKTVPLIADKVTNRSGGSTITLGNNGTVSGAGTNSYVVFISQNNSAETGGSVEAISIDNNFGGDAILYASHGLVDLDNSLTLKEVTGYKVSARNSAKIIYSTGLANLSFVSGPSGSYSIGGWGASQ